MKNEKLLLPISIIIGCSILGVFFYVAQISKQESIEKQQYLELQDKQAERRIEEAQKVTSTQLKIEQQKDTTALLDACLQDAEDWINGAVDAIVNLPPDPSNSTALDVADKHNKDIKEECFRKYD